MSIADGVELEQEGVFDRAASLYRRLLQQTSDPRERAEIHLRLAVALREDGEPDEAEESLDEAGDLLKGMDDARLSGLVALEHGQLAEDRMRLRAAARYYEAAASHLADSPDVHRATLRLASVLRRRGDYDGALAQLRDLEKSDGLPTDLHAEVADELGAALISHGSYEDAIEVLRRAVDLDRKADSEFAVGRSQLLLAEAHMLRGDRVEARQLLAAAEDVYDEAENKRGLSDYYLLYGRWYEENNDHDNAARHYRLGLRLDQASKDEVGQARALIRLASVRGKSGDLAEAAELLSEARSLLAGKDDDDVEMLTLLTEEGQLALRLYNFSEASRIFSRVLQKAQEDGDARSIALARRRLAIARRESGELGDAEQLLREALDVLRSRQDRRGIAEVLDDLGELLIERGQCEQALETLDEGQEYDEQIGATGTPKAQTFLLQGRAHLQLGHRDQAKLLLSRAYDEYAACEDDGGIAQSNYELGLWAAHEGHYRDAAQHLKNALEAMTKRTDRAGIVRAARALASLYRRLGDLERAEEYLDSAFRALGQTTDLPERGLLRAERARIALAKGDIAEAQTSAHDARRDLDAAGRPSEAAACVRVLAHVEVARRNWDRALDLLEQARTTFEEGGGLPELDDLYDDLGMIRMLVGDLDGAAEAINKSLELGERMGWYHGQGRSHMILGDIALRAGDVDQAGRNYVTALQAYNNAEDEVGRSECYQRLGDWHALNERWDDAIQEYKNARRLDQRHRDLRGLAQVSRKIGEVYLRRAQPERALESLEQAEDYLATHGSDDVERGHVELGLARVAAAHKNWTEGISHARRALTIFDRLALRDYVDETRRELVDFYKMVGKPDLALEQMRALGLAHETLWHGVLEELNPIVSNASRKAFQGRQYSQSVFAAFQAVEVSVREAAREPHDDIVKVLGRWFTLEERGVGSLRSERALTRLREFAVAAFDLFRNPAAHTGTQTTAEQAFIGIAVASALADRLYSDRVEPG
jgi:tetratricopeptide (TPR) repeat protein